MKVVISLGGSLLCPKNFDYVFAEKFSKFIKDMSEKHKFVIVTGGGKIARRFIARARKEKANEFLCDLEGIKATHINAKKLSEFFYRKKVEIPKNFSDAMKVFKKRGIVVMGGTSPGHSTDAVAALMAECINADLLINATNVSGVYNKNPRKYKDARLYKKISIKGLMKMLANYSSKAGKYELIDFIALQIIQRSKIKTIFLDGKNLENLKKAIEGKKFVGTTITF
ncbi:MAG: UMP kinase [Candidatus Altiarchaeota archaeon]